MRPEAGWERPAAVLFRRYGLRPQDVWCEGSRLEPAGKRPIQIRRLDSGGIFKINASAPLQA